MRRLIDLLIGVTMVLILLPAISRGAEKARPNVLLICVDDLKPALGCYGDPLAKSPNIDKLASRGLRFERAYCNQAVCSPSRNSLLTGQRPQSLGIYDLATNFRIAAPDLVTLPQHFKQQGYRTESLGKIFHVGHGNQDDRVSWSVASWKSDRDAYVLPKSKIRRGSTREGTPSPSSPARNRPRGAAYEAADAPDNAYPDGATADEAVHRLQAAATRPDQPFFLAVGFVKPHLPFCAPRKYWDLYDRASFEPAARQTPPDGAPEYAPQFGGELRRYKNIPGEGLLPPELQLTLQHGYYAAMSYMDAQIGRVLDELDRLDLASNTIIVFWGDHGWHLGDHGIWCKHTNYEQAAHIPLIVVAPGVTQEDTVSSSLAETVDIYPTLCELANLPRPAAQEFDGASFLQTLRDPSQATKDAIFHAYPRTPKDREPLIGRAVRTSRYRLVEWKQPGADPATADLELYDYEADPAELKNLAAEQSAVVSELREILAQQPEARPQITRPR
ncbi:MAG: sulfatase [Pirellulales bacterium]|nr:sulfatase [Pirellulales bacterium]